MDDIFSLVRDGNALQVRIWLDNTENDLNQGDDHRFSLLHWAAMQGRSNIVEMLINRGVRINATNMGDDTALHLAAAHGHRDIVQLLLHHKANVCAVNEHGNTPLHYACFWNYDIVSEELVNNGAAVNIENKFGETPLDKAKPSLAQTLKERAVTMGQDVDRVPYKDRSWLGYRTRSKDATLSRHSGIDIEQLQVSSRISSNHSGELWRGTWQSNDITAKILNLRECTIRMSRDFKEEYPRLRIFNHPNILPVLGACNQPPNLIIISQFMPFGSLYDVLHGETGIVVDQNQALHFAIDVARGMEFLHNMEPLIPNLQLSSKHVMHHPEGQTRQTEMYAHRTWEQAQFFDIIDEDLAKINVDDPRYQQDVHDGVGNRIDEDLSARINMADYRFSFHERNKEYSPAWLAPEALQRLPSDINQRAADMWSYAILLWELATREVPFADMSPMEVGMKVATEGLRVKIPPGTSQHMTRLVKICMNEEPAKRPRFDMIIPILEKMKSTG